MSNFWNWCDENKATISFVTGVLIAGASAVVIGKVAYNSGLEDGIQKGYKTGLMTGVNIKTRDIFDNSMYNPELDCLCINRTDAERGYTNNVRDLTLDTSKYFTIDFPESE